MLLFHSLNNGLPANSHSTETYPVNLKKKTPNIPINNKFRNLKKLK